MLVIIPIEIYFASFTLFFLPFSLWIALYLGGDFRRNRKIMMHYNYWQATLDIAWLAILVVLFYHFWNNRQFLIDAQGWLKAKGHITRYQLVKVGHRIWPKVEYEYCVYEQNLIGHYLFLDTAHNNPSSKYARRVAYRAAIAYKDHLEIDVYYNPNRPEESALDVTMPTKLNVILIIIGGLIIVQLAMMVFRLW